MIGNAMRGALLIHGFSGTPFEMEDLARHLSREGFLCETPLLAGHGSGARALGRTRWPDWLRSAEDALGRLRDRLSAPGGGAPRIAVIGQSMGGLLTLLLGRRHPELVRAIAVMATPLFLRGYQERAIRALCRSPLAAVALPKVFGSDVRDPAMRRKNPANRALPLRALGSLLDLMAEVRRQLPAIDRPALIAHALHDHTAPYLCMAELRLRIGTPRPVLRCLPLPKSYHLVTLDVERELLFAEILAHLNERI